jgi:hypothetical protein
MSKIARLLDSPFLARIVPRLPPETLHQLIRHDGLESCGELVLAATPAQLTAVLDLDLWRHARPGLDAQFDVDRFGEWLEVLVDAGDSVAARTVAALGTDLVIAGLSRYVRVFDLGIFEPTAQSDDEPIARDEAMHVGGSGDGLECEVGGYILRARRADAWDATVALLVALDAGHHDFFHAVMEGCRRLSNSRPEIDGLDDLLQAPEQHLHHIAIEREHRLAQQGYATPADARAFLEMARQPAHTRSLNVNPIVAAYFRAADEAPAASKETARSTIVELLADAGVIPERPLALPGAAGADPRAARWQRLMAYLRHSDETALLARSRELAFVANTLLAGCSVQSRPFTPQEASDAAAAICNLGLEHSPAHDLVTAFAVGWSVLHHEVSLFAADQLIAMLIPLDSGDPDIRRGLAALRRTLVKQRDAGTPWRARDAAEILAMLDMTAWIGVLGLLDECPVLPAALTAVLEGRTTTVSPTAFDFISTAGQIGDVRLFMRKLPGVLSR